VTKSARLIPLATLALALASCTAPGTIVPTERTSPATASPTPPVPSGAPSPTLPPAAVLDPMLTCGSDQPFSPAALQLPGFAEHEPDDAAAALRTFLETAAEDDAIEMMVDAFPRNGWRRVFQSERVVLFVAPSETDRQWVMVQFARGDTGWTIDGYGQCHMQIALPEGIGRATWWLDPAADPPGQEATELSALIVEQSCASGQPPVGRVLAPAIVYGADAITITIAVRVIGGDCPSNPAFPLTIQLAEPLGDRALLDGSVFPPRDASAPLSES
jgi:hypothetical protein